MAGSSKRDPVIHKVWTFLIRGGEPFEIRLPRTPKCEHDGGLTVWKLVGTKGIANATKSLMRETGATVKMYTEAQSDEQAALRQERLGRG